jgi:hypothetical protein
MRNAYIFFIVVAFLVVVVGLKKLIIGPSTQEAADVNSRSDSTMKQKKSLPNLDKLKGDLERTLANSTSVTDAATTEADQRAPSSEATPISKFDDFPAGIQKLLTRLGASPQSPVITMGESDEILFETELASVEASEFRPEMGKVISEINGNIMFQPSGDACQTTDCARVYLNPANWQRLVATGGINCYYKNAALGPELLQVASTYPQLEIIKHDTEIQILLMKIKGPKSELSKIFMDFKSNIPAGVLCSLDFLFKLVTN